MNASKSSAPDDNDAFDDLLNDFKNRNKARTSPEYVLETMDTDSISNKYIRMLREPSLVEENAPLAAVEETDVSVSTDTDSNKGLTLLSENYTKKARSKDNISAASGFAAITVLLVGLLTLALIANMLLLGLAFGVLALVLWIVRRVTARQAQETRNIASALLETETE